MSKTVHNVVKDIYDLVSTKEIPEGVDADAIIEDFGEAIKEMMKTQFSEYSRDPRRLRLSAIGHPDRKLWHTYNETAQESIQPHTYIKFLYGHLIEEMMVFLTRMAGHEVTDQQKQCEVEGVKGSMDCRIDGVLVDVKSASTYGFKKFKENTLMHDDPFGYIAQLKAYAKSEGDTKFGWLTMEKQNGHLHYLEYDLEEMDEFAPQIITSDVSERVKHVKEMVQQPEPPEHCYKPVPDGKSGNMKLPMGCSYCQYKKACWPEARLFVYSNGPKYLTEVKRLPNVTEIPMETVDAEENN